MKALALILCLAGGAAGAEPAGPDEKTRIQLAEYMLKTPLDEANPVIVSGFMKLDAEALPKKLREKARAKQMEIASVVKIHAGSKKGPFRFPSPTCTPKRYQGPEGIRIMSLIQGNSPIEGEEEEYIEKKTDCTEDQLICEFSLNVVIVPRPNKPPLKHYFLMEADPLMALVAEKRGGGGSAGNNYFQALKPTCQKSVAP